MINVIFFCSAEAYVSIQRLQDFLLMPETKQTMNHSRKPKRLNMESLKNCGNARNTDDTEDEVFSKNQSKHFDAIAGDSNGIFAISYNRKLCDDIGKRIEFVQSTNKFIRLENVTATWKRIENHQMNGIFDINVEIKSGLCAIVGQVGSCKTTLLNVILGELPVDVGTVKLNGSISYASQEPWLFDGSVRSNIVFVDKYDDNRYEKVIDVCALQRDFEQLPQGDETIIGERGILLSGGQKARINLARAIYRQSDIYLLDDPLSAVDTHVGKHIFEKCVMEFLADKICVLVTHQLQYLTNVNHVILMSCGKVEVEGPFQTLQRFNKESLMNTQVDSDQRDEDFDVSKVS